MKKGDLQLILYAVGFLLLVLFVNILVGLGSLAVKAYVVKGVFGL